MTELQDHIQPGPVRKRLKVLDALRGFALLGVCLANYKELTLYAFYDVGHTTNVEVSMMDQIANFLMYLLVDGKFYTIFSVLFSIGFSIIISKTKLPLHFDRSQKQEVVGAAIGVYLFEVACSFLWLRYFAYGPLEWIWRMLTYGKRLPLKVREL